MFSVKDTNTVNGIATNNVGANDTRATNHACSKTPATETALKHKPHGVRRHREQTTHRSHRTRHT